MLLIFVIVYAMVTMVPYGFSMVFLRIVFLWFCDGFPMAFLWFSYGCPMVF